MNILFTTFQGDVAGSTNSMFYLAVELQKRGHQVFMACRPESLIWGMLKNTDVKTIPMYFKSRFDLKAAKKIRKLVESHKIDLINSQSGLDRYTIIWSRLFYGNSCTHVNTRRQRPKSDGGYLVNRFIASNTDKIVAVSQSIKQDLVRIGYPERHIEVIYNGTPFWKYKKADPTRIAKLREELKINGSVPVLGSISRPKKHKQLLLALNHIKKKVKLILVGIEETDFYREIINKYEIPHEVHFTGTVPNEVVIEYLSIFDIKILPSTFEGISQSLLEAMAMGVPVIATNASGNPELVKDGENGLLFEDGDIEGLASKISYLLENPGKSNKYSEMGRETALKRFSIGNTVSRYEELYESLTNKS